MNLISCDHCGVVLDASKLKFPDVYDEDGNIESLAHWTGDKFVSTMPCPVCEGEIKEES